jgi:hypothetical protein
MKLSQKMRGRTMVLGPLTGLMVMVAAAAPAAASDDSVALRTTSVNETTNIVACPKGTPVGIVCAVGSGGLQSNSLGLVSEKFVSRIDFAHPDAAGHISVLSLATLSTGANGTGDRLFLVAKGDFNPKTGVDNEQITVVGGTGRFEEATGSGTIVTQQTGANPTGTVIFSISTINATITLS